MPIFFATQLGLHQYSSRLFMDRNFNAKCLSFINLWLNCSKEQCFFASCLLIHSILTSMGKNKTLETIFSSSLLCLMVNIKSQSLGGGIFWSNYYTYSSLLVGVGSWLSWMEMLLWNLSLVTHNLKLLNSRKAVSTEVFNLMETFIAQFFVLSCLI